MIGKPLEMSELSKELRTLVNNINSRTNNLIKDTNLGGVSQSSIDCNDNWYEHKGENDYYIKNKCCKDINYRGNQTKLGFSQISQYILDYLFKTKQGRDHFINYWVLISNIAKDYGCVFGFELMNEPIYFDRKNMYATWVEVANKVTEIIPDISIGICEFSSGSIYNEIIDYIISPPHIKYNNILKTSAGTIIRGLLKNINHHIAPVYPKINEIINNSIPDKSDLDYIRASNNIFYCWHWYGTPKLENSIENAKTFSNLYNIPHIMTESTHCELFSNLWNKKEIKHYRLYGWKYKKRRLINRKDLHYYFNSKTGDISITHPSTNEISGFIWRYTTYCNTNLSNDDLNKITTTEQGGTCSNNNINNKDDCSNLGYTWNNTFGACILGWGSWNTDHCTQWKCQGDLEECKSIKGSQNIMNNNPKNREKCERLGCTYGLQN